MQNRVGEERHRVYGPGVDEALAQTHQGDNYRSYLLLHDGQGSVTAALYTANNQVMYRNSYRAFGATTRYDVQSSVNPSRITYTGREMAPAQLLFYRARYMDTSNGNFLSQDTYRGDATAPPSLHRYIYALNNPVRYVDPSGNSILGELTYNLFDALLGVAGIVTALFAMGEGVSLAVAGSIVLGVMALILAGVAYSQGWISGWSLTLYFLLLALSILAIAATGGLGTIAGIVGIIAATYLLWQSIKPLIGIDIDSMRNRIEVWLISLGSNAAA